MKAVVILTLTVLLSFYSFSQEIFKYGELNISFPQKYANQKLDGVNVFYLNKDSVSYQVLILQDTSMRLKNENELVAYLEGTSGSFLKESGIDFKNVIKDTTIGGAKGRYIHIYEPTKAHTFKEAWVFFTALLNHPYAIQVMRYGTIDEVSKRRIKNFFSSIKFEGKQFDPLSVNSFMQATYSFSFFDVKSVTFPTRFDTLEQKGVKIYYARQPNIMYQFMYSTAADMDSTDHYKRDYDNFLKGYFSSNSIKPFVCEVNDSTIGGAKGKFVHGHLSDKPTQIFTFITMLHGRSYMIQILISELNAKTKVEMDSFLENVVFAS